MRIALVNSLFPELGIGGSEISTFYLARGLIGLGHEVRVLSQNVGEESVLEEFEGVPVFRLGSAPGYEPNVLARPRLEIDVLRGQQDKVEHLSDRMRPAIEDFAPDIINTAVVGNPAGFWKLASDMGIPLVHTLRSYSLLCHRRMLRGIDPCTRQCFACATKSRRSARNHSNFATGVIAISDHVLDVHSRSGWFSNVTHRAVIANSYEPTLESVPDKSGAYDFGYLGRIHETKGVEELLQAFTALRSRGGKGKRLLIAGDGNPDYVEDLKQRFDHPDIEFAGYIDQTEFFEKVRICVVPSIWFEPFGRVFAESLHHGTPVLGSSRGGGAEILDNDTGWLFDPGNPDDFLASLEKVAGLSDDRYNEMTSACLASASSYSVPAIARQYQDFYQECLA
ncbi:glycosyltransferase [Croceicoccus gelatinilyticus]|uniref:glycosyltransferase n=1 Tax=Croceicoccus gelatinilyticus TaxID=2835536 RepID=UPI001CED0D60|nr:glycosyltransferase [Croceicoccus gelatinilyticus]